MIQIDALWNMQIKNLMLKQEPLSIPKKGSDKVKKIMIYKIFKRYTNVDWTLSIV